MLLLFGSSLDFFDLFGVLCYLVAVPESFKLVGGAFSDEKVGDSNVVRQSRCIVISTTFLGLNGKFFLLAFQLLLLRFDVILSLRVGTLDDGQGQIEKEKGANEDHGDEEKDGKRRVGLLVHDHDL